VRRLCRAQLQGSRQQQRAYKEEEVKLE
jgi:hypothetical protein